MKLNKLLLLGITFLFPYFVFSQSPENSPASVTWDGQNLTMTHNGAVILQGRLENPESLEYYNVLEDSAGKTPF